MEDKQIFIPRKFKVAKKPADPFNINPFNNGMTLAGFQPAKHIRHGVKKNGI